jgi:hypothetical protein
MPGFLTGIPYDRRIKGFFAPTLVSRLGFSFMRGVST